MKVLPSLLCLLLLLAEVSLAQPPTEEELPTIEEMVLPSVQELLNGKEVDWIELNTGRVLTVDSVVPRPETIKLREEEIEALEEVRNKTPVSQREAIAKKLDEKRHLYVSLPDVQGNPEFRLPLKRIVKIVHHEDLMLRRIHRLLEENKIDPALELMNRLRRDWDTWPGLDETQLQILFVDAKFRISKGDAATSLMLLDEVHRLDKDYPGLRTQSGYAIQELVEKGLADSDYPRAQFYLNWLRQRFSNHDVYNTFSAQIIAKTNELVNQSNIASSQGKYKEAAELIAAAAKIWPLAPSLKGPHRTHTERFQQLTVGVMDLPGQSDAYFALSPADLRKKRLTQLNLFELERLRDGTAYYRTRFFDEWEPTDLGREMRFTLKQFRQPYEMQAVVTSADIVPLLINRLTPGHPAFDERLSSYVESVEVHSPTEFSLSFRRVPPRIEPLLANISLSLEGDASQSGEKVDPGGFQILTQDENSLTYNRKIEEPEGLPKYHIAELIEKKYDSYEKAAQALTRGEVSMIPDLPDWIIRRMQDDEEFMKRFFILPYQLPETHLLQFNPASKPVRSRELRTALAYAVDREKLLREVVLRDPDAQNGKVVTTPFLSSNPGRNILVEPRRYDLSASIAMLLANQKQQKGEIPPLTMIVAPGPTSEKVAQEIAATWEKIGLKITLVYAHQPRPENWDIIFRSVQMVEPLVDIWPFLTIEERARLDDLRDYPDWLKQELIQLDRTSEQSRAISALQVLHRHLWSDTAVFPLWELQKFAVIRKNIQGYPKTLMHCYDQLDRWTVDSWYQTELP